MINGSPVGYIWFPVLANQLSNIAPRASWILDESRKCKNVQIDEATNQLDLGLVLGFWVPCLRLVA